MKTIALILTLLIAGCTQQAWHPDNRVRIKPKIDLNLTAEKEAELRLYVLRNLWEQDALKRAELYYIERNGE